jgi:hypothetical protein
MTEPDAANARGGNEEATLGQFVRHAHLAQSRLLQGHFHNGLFNVILDPILRARFASADLPQRQLAALVVQFLKAVKTVPGIPHHLAGFRDTAEHFAELQQPHFVFDDLLFGVHADILLTAPPRSLSNVRSS